MSFSSNTGAGPLSEINVTPMVDVMLVLLIIFMITAPVATKSIQIDLPQPNTKHEPPKDPPPPVNLRISAGGVISWNNNALSELQLRAQLLILGTKPLDRQSELRIQADDETVYEVLAKLMADAKNAGVKKIGFQK